MSGSQFVDLKIDTRAAVEVINRAFRPLFAHISALATGRRDTAATMRDLGRTEQ